MEPSQPEITLRYANEIDQLQAVEPLWECATWESTQRSCPGGCARLEPDAGKRTEPLTSEERESGPRPVANFNRDGKSSPDRLRIRS